MKSINISFLLLFQVLTCLGQDIAVSFSATGEAIHIDSVTAMNQTKQVKITIPGDALLHLRSSSGIQNSFEISDQLSVYPNPFSGMSRVMVNISRPQQTKLSMQKLTGQVLAQADQYLQPGLHAFDIALGETGIYFLILLSDTGLSSCKLINLSDSKQAAQISQVGYGDWQQTPSMKIQVIDQGRYELDFAEDDRIHYTCYSGSMTTIFTDVPDKSKNYEVEFEVCVDPEGKHYRVVKIGDQMWMEENLAYLPDISSPTEGSDSLPHYYVYDYLGSEVAEAKQHENYSTYGVLYNWPAIMQGEASSLSDPSGVQGICPEGWHVASIGEWQTMLDHLGDDDHIKIKSSSEWCDSCVGDNSSGFNALPGGLFDTNDFYQLWNVGRFWSSTRKTSWNLWQSGLGLSSQSRIGASIRCLKNTGQPVANFNFIPTIGTDTSQFYFDASHSFVDETSADNLKTRWDWNGDGVWDTPLKEGNTVSFQFPEAGSYKVILEVQSIDGQTDTQYKYVTVADGIYSDQRDSNTYFYKSIGNQIWMIENMAYLPYLSSSSLISDWSEPELDRSEQYYVYGYKGKVVSQAKQLPNYMKYGVLYNRKAAVSACPVGWHLPSGNEWYELNNYLIDNGYGFEGDPEAIGKALASASDWNYTNRVGSIGHDLETNNSSGFGALPGGQRYYDSFESLGRWTSMWSSELGTLELYGAGKEGFSSWMWGGNGANSVRCIKGIGRPTVTTDSVSSITQRSAIIYSTVHGTGGDHNLVAKGVCWAKTQSPSLVDHFTFNGIELDSYSSIMTNLETGTIYYVRSFAINSEDTAYGRQLELKTVDSTGTFIDSRDNTEYKWVKIDNQIWMAENLAYLPAVHASRIGSDTIAMYYVYGYNGYSVPNAKVHPNYDRFGVLYNWIAALAGASSSNLNPSEVKGICPIGWHLPSFSEWRDLSKHRDGKYLAANTGWLTSTGDRHVGNDLTKNNHSGFNALPAGRSSAVGGFLDQGKTAHFWTSTGTDESFARSYDLLYNEMEIEDNYSDTQYGFSVRCVKGGTKPMASIDVSTTVGGPSTVFRFDASASYDGETPPEKLLFRWDLNGDSIWDSEYDTCRMRTQVYPESGFYLVFVEVKDIENMTATDSVWIRVFEGSFIDIRDGNEYPYQVYGTQTWMAKNLAFLPEVSIADQESDSLKHYYVYDNESHDILKAKKESNYGLYGVLYNWPAASDACPAGWHLPSDEEWTVFTDYLINKGYGFEGSGEDIAKSIASKTGWKLSYRYEPGDIGYDPSSNNSSLFSAQPAGYRHFKVASNRGDFRYLNYCARFWTSTMEGTNLVWSRAIYASDGFVHKNRFLKRVGFSIRCVKN